MCVVWFDNNMTTKREEVDGGGGDDDDDNGLLFFLIFPWEMPYVRRGGRERERAHLHHRDTAKPAVIRKEAHAKHTPVCFAHLTFTRIKSAQL